jgi:cellulose synthase operon protein YhjQ
MDMLTDHSEEPLAETPEDVAILYSWANLHGAKYRDFSASRREYRAQVRHRAAEDMRHSELQAKAEAERAAAEAERTAREAERIARSPDSYDSSADRERAIRDAEDAARRAAAERVEAARRAESAAIAEAVARREEREIAEAHASAQRQAKSYSNSEMRRRVLAGPQPIPVGLASDPYENTISEAEVEAYNAQRKSLSRSSSGQFASYRPEYPPRTNSSGERRAYRPEMEVRRRPQGYRPDEASGIRPAYRPPTSTPVETTRERIIERGMDDYRAAEPQNIRNDAFAAQQRQLERERQPGPDSTPAWLYGGSASQPPVTPQAPARLTPVPDSLQYSRERVASRWYALKGVFEPGQEPTPDTAPARERETRTPMLAIFSLAGGVGKTSLVATLGRALSSLGEKVLLADTTSHGLLPYYFGASELRPGVVRTFSPPSGSTDAPIYLVSYDVDQTANDPGKQEVLLDELARSSSGTYRILLDLNASSGWMLRRISSMYPTLLVPVAPDMNSVISLEKVESYFQGIIDPEGRTIQPFYVLNQFDAALPLHLDVREVLRRQLGERLLPFVIRRAPAVSEALAEGMTVVDYAPDASVAEDYMNIAGWLRNLSPPATQGIRNARWSER